MIYTIGRHIQMLIETPESVARRELRPRCKPRFELMCTCRTRRDDKGHCPHTLTVMESVRPEKRRDVTLAEMSAKEATNGKPIRPRIDLERENLRYRRALEDIANGGMRASMATAAAAFALAGDDQ